MSSHQSDQFTPPPHARDDEHDTSTIVDYRISPNSSSPSLSSPSQSQSSSLIVNSNDYNKNEVRDFILRSTLLGCGSGLLAGLGFATFTNFPFHRALTSMALNGGMFAFTFSGLSVSIAHHSKFDRHSLPNHIISGALTGSAIYPLLCARDGLINDAKSAIRFTMKGTMGGIIGGTIIYGLTSFIVNRQSSQSSPEVNEIGRSWLPSWVPVRRSTAADLEAVATQQKQREDRHRAQQHFQQLQFPPNNNNNEEKNNR